MAMCCNKNDMQISSFKFLEKVKSALIAHIYIKKYQLGMMFFDESNCLVNAVRISHHFYIRTIFFNQHPEYMDTLPFVINYNCVYHAEIICRGISIRTLVPAGLPS